MGKELITKIEHIARKETESGITHHWEHTQRVREMALRIGREERADLEVLELAALLHDIARKDEEADPDLCHAEEGARKAEKILAESGYSKTSEVLHCIESHRFSRPKKPETLEARVLQDADRLDAIGATGIVRCFMHHGALGSESDGKRSRTQGAVMHFYDKLLKLKDTMHTVTARRIASERHEYMVQFLERLEKESKGEL